MQNLISVLSKSGMSGFGWSGTVVCAGSSGQNLFNPNTGPAIGAGIGGAADAESEAKSINDANLGLGSEEMYRLICLYFAAFLLSFVCFASIKLFVMIFVAYFYGGGFLWASSDTRFVLVNGSLLGLVFCVFVTVEFVRKK